jgi:hypothetical protein
VLEVVIEGATGDAGDGFVPVLCCIWFAESPDNDGAFFENESDLSLPIISDNDGNDCLTARTAIELGAVGAYRQWRYIPIAMLSAQ